MKKIYSLLVLYIYAMVSEDFKHKTTTTRCADARDGVEKLSWEAPQRRLSLSLFHYRSLASVTASVLLPDSLGWLQLHRGAVHRRVRAWDQ